MVSYLFIKLDKKYVMYELYKEAKTQLDLQVNAIVVYKTQVANLKRLLKQSTLENKRLTKELESFKETDKYNSIQEHNKTKASKLKEVTPNKILECYKNYQLNN